jgi:uncharacterized protein (DUF362 family)
MEVTQEGSMEIYRKLLEDPPTAYSVPCKPMREELYSFKNKHSVALVRSDSRDEGIRKGIELIGGLSPLIQKLEGDILIKPNCNTDDPYPRDTHPLTVATIARCLIEEGFPSKRIFLGEMSGRARGLPTRQTVVNLGIAEVVDELDLQASYFEAEEWVKVKPPKSRYWPEGIKIPRRVYDAGRIILTPIIRPHATSNFTLSLKLAVGFIDAPARDWLHNGEGFYEKMIEINLAYSADLIVADASEIITRLEGNSQETVKPGIIVVGSNRVATDAVLLSLLKHYGAHGFKGVIIPEHSQFTISEQLGLGKALAESIDFRIGNLAEDKFFDDLVSSIKLELS